MRWLPWVLVLALLSPFVPIQAQLPASVANQVPAQPELGQRLYVMVMDGTEFNGLSWPNTPLLEAYVGETLTFYVMTSPAAAASHTFHVHGHPWWDNEINRFIDNKLLHPGETHQFSVTAGTIRGNAGDWFYHCHVDQHFDQGMWGILRVYPFGMSVTGPLDDLTVTVDRRGEAVPTTELSLTLDGQPVAAEVTRTATNTFHVQPQLPAGTDGQLVVHAENALGESLARLELTGTGYELVRHVIPDTLGDAAAEQLIDQANAGTVDPDGLAETLTVHPDTERPEATQ